MKNYSRRTNQKVTRYRTPSPFRIRQHRRVLEAYATSRHSRHTR